MTRKDTTNSQQTKGDNAEIVESVNPLEKRVETLQIELEMADPTRQSLAFPNIDLELSFD